MGKRRLKAIATALAAVPSPRTTFSVRLRLTKNGSFMEELVVPDIAAMSSALAISAAITAGNDYIENIQDKDPQANYGIQVISCATDKGVSIVVGTTTDAPPVPKVPVPTKPFVCPVLALCDRKKQLGGAGDVVVIPIITTPTQLGDTRCH